MKRYSCKNLEEVVSRIESVDAISVWTGPISERKLNGNFVQRPSDKPDGIWYACGPEWLRWECQHNSSSEFVYVYKLLIDKSDFVTIRSADDFDRFMSAYKLNSDWEIDWPRITREFTGIEICPYIWARRRTLWYYSWDVASGCFWDRSVLRQVERI